MATQQLTPTFALTKAEIADIVRDLRAKGEHAHADELEQLGAALHGNTRYLLLRGFEAWLRDEKHHKAADEALKLANDARRQRKQGEDAAP